MWFGNLYICTLGECLVSDLHTLLEKELNNFSPEVIGPLAIGPFFCLPPLQLKSEGCLGHAPFLRAPPASGFAQSCWGLRPPWHPLCLRCHPFQLGFLGESAQQQESGQASGPLGQDSLGRAKVWSLVHMAYAPGESLGKWAPACHGAGRGREGGSPFCWVNTGVQACLGTSLYYVG